MLARRTTSALAAATDTMLHIEQNVRRGRRGDVVRLIQEWLCLNDCGVMIDGRFGWATEQAVQDFQGSTGVLPVTGEVDPQTYAMLIRPMTEGLRMIEPPPGATMGQLVAAYALQHLRSHAREVGGQNRGPWVRLYLHGDQRPRQADLPQGAAAWCAGFVSTMLAQATATAGSEPALDYHTNCNRLAEDAIRRKRSLPGASSSSAKAASGTNGTTPASSPRPCRSSSARSKATPHTRRTTTPRGTPSAGRCGRMGIWTSSWWTGSEEEGLRTED